MSLGCVLTGTLEPRGGQEERSVDHSFLKVAIEERSVDHSFSRVIGE